MRMFLPVRKFYLDIAFWTASAEKSPGQPGEMLCYVILHTNDTAVKRVKSCP